MSKFSNLFAAQDMTQGEPWKKISAFAVPLLIGNIAQQMYNTSAAAARLSICLSSSLSA